jgi:hypothetical protein
MGERFEVVEDDRGGILNVRSRLVHDPHVGRPLGAYENFCWSLGPPSLQRNQRLRPLGASPTMDRATSFPQAPAGIQRIADSRNLG